MPLAAAISKAYIIAEPIPCFGASGEASGVKQTDHNSVKKTNKIYAKHMSEVQPMK